METAEQERVLRRARRVRLAIRLVIYGGLALQRRHRAVVEVAGVRSDGVPGPRARRVIAPPRPR